MRVVMGEPKGYLFTSKVGSACHVKVKRPQKKCYVAALRASWQLLKIGSWKVLLSLLITDVPTSHIFSFFLLFFFWVLSLFRK